MVLISFELREILRDIRQRHAAAAANWIWTLPVPGTAMNTVVEHELENNPDGSFLRLFVEIYDKKSEPQLAAIKDLIFLLRRIQQEKAPLLTCRHIPRILKSFLKLEMQSTNPSKYILNFGVRKRVAPSRFMRLFVSFAWNWETTMGAMMMRSSYRALC